MKTSHVIVTEYNPKWTIEFEKIKEELLTVLGGKAIAIEHVGSTSVEGLAAKPIIDIDVVINGGFKKVREALEAIDYIYEGDLGIPGREAFRYIDKPHLMMHHLYVCSQGCEELHRHITFRNYLREHPEDRDAYGSVKMEMAKKYPENIESYCAGKQQVIETIYRKCGLID